MFNQAYSEILDEGQETARSEEKQVLTEAVALMRESDREPGDQVKRITTIHRTTKIWSYFLNDVASPENAGSDEFKATFISIGIFVLKHLKSMREDRSLSFEPVAGISETILKGLE